MFGGLIKGIENDGIINIMKFFFVKLIYIGSNRAQSLPLESYGSTTTLLLLI
jgi:hypothetical protein